jgi:hypothetical protein
VSHVRAAEIETLVIRTLREHLDPLPPIDDRSLINDFVARVEIQQERLGIQVADASGKKSHEGTGNILHVPWQRQTQLAAASCFCPQGPSCESSVQYAQRSLRAFRSFDSEALTVGWLILSAFATRV